MDSAFQVQSFAPENGDTVNSADAPEAQDGAPRLNPVLDELALILSDPAGTEDLPGRVGAIAGRLIEILDRDADAALFHVLRYGRNRYALYSVIHAAQCAMACEMVARRLRLSPAETDSLVRAALTMNIAITELQGALAARSGLPNRLHPDQARAISSHPVRGAEILRAAGVDDEDWLRAVEQHHERPAGKGYPHQVQEPSRLATMLRYVDSFFAKISARASRPALAMRRAARHLYGAPEGRTVVEALVRILGLYPPGTYVRLMNGDLGIVLRRGERLNAPIVVALANANGERMSRRIYRDTGEPRYAVLMASNAAGSLNEPRRSEWTSRL